MDPLEERRTRVILKEHYLDNVESTNFPGTYPGHDDSWNLEKFKQTFKICIIRLEDMEMEFDIIGLDVAIVNSLRRILLSEVPTMAVDKVFMNYNTSIIQDEVLVHRMAMIPIKADPRLFEYRMEGDEDGSPEDTLEFSLQVKCTRNPSATKDATDPEDLYNNHMAYSKQLVWVPIGSQADLYQKDTIRPVHDDIIIAKLRPGHEIDLKLHCVKGIGKNHTKFSPVATASYRLLPEITLLRDVTGEQAERLARSFSPGVIELKDDGKGNKVAKVVNARKDTCSRNVLRHDDLKDSVKMTRVKDHLIFSIESTGALTPDILMVEAVKILMGKCQTFMDIMDSSHEY